MLRGCGATVTSWLRGFVAVADVADGLLLVTGWASEQTQKGNGKGKGGKAHHVFTFENSGCLYRLGLMRGQGNGY